MNDLFLGIDVGGTKTALAVIDRSGTVHAQHRIATGTYAETLGSVVQAAKAMPVVRGAGIGLPGPIRADGTFGDATNLPDWRERPVLIDLKQQLGLPVAGANDADCALLGEVVAGAARPWRDQPVAMLTLGTGMGGAWWDGERLGHGDQRDHPEIGHLAVDPAGEPCVCGIRGCLESWCSGTALARTAVRLGFADAGALVAAAEAGDARARGALTKLADRLAQGVWTLLHVLHPAAVILGGGVIERSGHHLLPAVTRLAATARYRTRPVAILPAAQGNHAGVIGAAALAWLDNEKPR